MSKQRITYRPQIKHTADYQTEKSVQQSEIPVKSGSNRQPLDTHSIPQIESNIQYLDAALKAIPTSLSKALHEIYDPVKDIFYETLIDKIVDPNPPKPPVEIIPKPTPPGPEPDPDPNPDPPVPDPDPDPDDPEKKKKVYPIILKPIKFKDDDPEDPDPPEPIPEDEAVHPIILEAIKDDDEDPEDKNPIEAPLPIVLLPITSPGYEPGDNTDPDDDDDDDEEDDDDDLWKKPDVGIKYREPDIRKEIDKEFIYLLTKVILFYTNKLKDLLNNYIYNVLRYTIGLSSENVIFVNNTLELTSNDILNHSKHLLDISVKDEDMAALKTEYLKNTFNVKHTTTHLRSFYVANELRCRYTDIKYSRGRSKVNSMSDAFLTQMHMKYELQFRNDFENLFRYLNSSLKVTEDIIKLHVENKVSKSTLVKKNGRRKKK